MYSKPKSFYNILKSLKMKRNQIFKEEENYKKFSTSSQFLEEEDSQNKDLCSF
jgi:hypothetical protein